MVTWRPLIHGLTSKAAGLIALCRSALVAPSSSGRVAGRVVTATVPSAAGWTPVTATSAPCGAAGVGGLSISWPGWTAAAADSLGGAAVLAAPSADPAAAGASTAVPAFGS